MHRQIETTRKSENGDNSENSANREQFLKNVKLKNSFVRQRDLTDGDRQLEISRMCIRSENNNNKPRNITFKRELKVVGDQVYTIEHGLKRYADNRGQ